MSLYYGKALTYSFLYSVKFSDFTDDATTELSADTNDYASLAISYQMLDVDEQEAEYLLIAENVERRGQAETDPIKKSRIANFLKEYWGVKKGSNQMRHFDASKTTKGIGELLGENERSTQRLMKLHDLIPQLQRLVSAGKLGTTAGGANVTNEIKGGGIANQSQELSSDINIITAEINAYQRVAGEAIFEIGRRLKHVKENDLAHGEFMEWYESIGLTKDFVSKTIRIFDNLPNFETSRNIGLEALYQIATLPPEQREVEHITEKGETKKPEDMTVRELRELKKALKASEQAKEQAERQADIERSQRLKHVKENDLAHGEFGDWAESIGMDDSIVRKFIRIVEELDDGKRYTYTELGADVLPKKGLQALYEIATLPPEQREAEHLPPSYT